MEIKEQILGKWQAVMETYQFLDENESKVHEDQISSDVPYTIDIYQSIIVATEFGERPVESSYEVQKDVLDYYLVVFVGTETQISQIKLFGNNLTLISEPEDMKYQEMGVWKKAFRTQYTIEFSRASL